MSHDMNELMAQKEVAAKFMGEIFTEIDRRGLCPACTATTIAAMIINFLNTKTDVMPDPPTVGQIIGVILDEVSETEISVSEPTEDFTFHS